MSYHYSHTTPSRDLHCFWEHPCVRTWQEPEEETKRFPQTGAGRGMHKSSSRVVMNCAADEEHCQDVRPPPNKIRAALRKARPKWCKERATRTSKCGSVGKATNKSPMLRPLFHKTLSLNDLGRYVCR